MPIPRAGRRSPLSRLDFDSALREWIDTAVIGEMIGDSPDFGGKAWLHIIDAGCRYYWNADSTREGVREYLDLLAFDPGLDWQVVPNQKGRMVKVAFGPDIAGSFEVLSLQG